MPISFKYPITKADGSEFESEQSLLTHLSGEPAGSYLLSAHGFWHGGLHISDATSGHVMSEHPVRCMATGEVVAYRLNDDYRTSTWGTDAQTLKYSTSFCLVRHTYESPKKAPVTTPTEPRLFEQSAINPSSTAAFEFNPFQAQQAPQPIQAPLQSPAEPSDKNTLVFYSLYMHLLPYTAYDARQPPKYWQSSQKRSGILIERVYARHAPAGQNAGATIHLLPIGTKVEIQQERTLKLKDSQKLFAEVKVLSFGAGATGTIKAGDVVWISAAKEHLALDPIVPDVFNRVVICNPPVSIEAGAPVGYLGLYETPDGGTGKVSRHQVHLEIFTGDPKFEDFFANAAGLTEGKRYKVAGTRGGIAQEEIAADGKSTFKPGIESLLLPVIVDTTSSPSKKDAQGKTWFSITGLCVSGEQSGWILESRLQDVVQYDWEKLGYRKIEEANDNADGYMDLERMPEFFQQIQKLIIHQSAAWDVTPEDLLNASRNPTVRNALAHLVAKHPSEWQGKSDAAKWNVLKEKEELLKNDPVRLRHEQERIDQLVWWDEIQGVTNFPASPNVWHFNPVGFVGNLSARKVNLNDLIQRIGDIISHGEGNYESYNSGTKGVPGGKVGRSFLSAPAGTVTDKTINEIIATDALSGTDPNRFFATGKYQTIIGTLSGAKTALGLTGNEKYDAAMQERVFREYLFDEAKGLSAFVKKNIGTVDDAQYAAAKVWASISTPAGMTISPKYGGTISDGTLSFYQKPKQNAANQTSTKMLRKILEEVANSRQGKP